MNARRGQKMKTSAVTSLGGYIRMLGVRGGFDAPQNLSDFKSKSTRVGHSCEPAQRYFASNPHSMREMRRRAGRLQVSHVSGAVRHDGGLRRRTAHLGVRRTRQ